MSVASSRTSAAVTVMWSLVSGVPRGCRDGIPSGLLLAGTAQSFGPLQAMACSGV
jgi:hypothetical protein